MVSGGSGNVPGALRPVVVFVVFALSNLEKLEDLNPNKMIC